MSQLVQTMRSRAKEHAEELFEAIEHAEAVIISTIERECEALRTGRMLAAEALHLRLSDASRLYLDATRAARASIWALEQIFPGCEAVLEERRSEFSALLKVELAVLSAERAAAGRPEPADTVMPPARAGAQADAPGRSAQGPAPVHQAGARLPAMPAAPGIVSLAGARGFSAGERPGPAATQR